LDPLALGAIAAVVIRDPVLVNVAARLIRPIAILSSAIVLTIAIAVQSTSFKAPVMNSIGYLGLAALYCSLVMHCVFGGAPSVLRTAMRSSVMRSLGKYSYGIYVLHYPILDGVLRVRSRLVASMPGNITEMLFWLSAIGVGFLSSYGAARLSWKILEKPFLDLKRYFDYDVLPVRGQ